MCWAACSERGTSLEYWMINEQATRQKPILWSQISSRWSWKTRQRMKQKMSAFKDQTGRSVFSSYPSHSQKNSNSLQMWRFLISGWRRPEWLFTHTNGGISETGKEEISWKCPNFPFAADHQQINWIVYIWMNVTTATKKTTWHSFWVCKICHSCLCSRSPQCIGS